MSAPLAVAYLIGGAALLTAGAEFLVRSAQTLALRWGMEPLVVGLTVVAFGTSAPELVGSVVAALANSPDLALGNVVGSNIANLTLVLGMAVLFTTGLVHVHGRAIEFDSPLAVALTLLAIWFLADGYVGVVEGGLLTAGLAAYTAYRVLKRDQVVDSNTVEDPTAHTLPYASPVLILICLASVGALSGGAYFFVGGSREIAGLLGVPEKVIGLTVMALGTSLPELATVIVAARKGMSDLVIGNVVGSNIFNILSVVGLTSLVVSGKQAIGGHGTSGLGPFDLDPFDLSMFVGTMVGLLILVRVRPRFGKIMGSLMLAIYLVYVVYLYSTGSS
jgi:cation:H+ antiporter